MTLGSKVLRIPTPAQMYLQTLGGLQLERLEAGGQLTVIQRGGKPLLLLAWLARREGRSQEKAAVARRFWPDAEAAAARKSLRQALHVLRPLIGADAFRDERETLSLRPGVVSLDLARLHEAVGRGDVGQVLDLYRGPFLPRVESWAGDALGEWIATERSRLQLVVFGLVRPRVEELLRLANIEPAVELARALVRADASTVSSVELLCDALVAAGRLEEAATAVVHCDPGDDDQEQARLRAIEQRLVKLRSTVGNGRRGGSGLDAPVDPSSEAQQTSESELIGRDAEVSTIMQWVEDARAGHRRRACVTGRAGIGKSSLLDAVGVRARWRGARVVRVAFSPAMQDAPLSALREFLGVIGALPGAAGIQPASAARLVALVPALTAHFPGAEPEADGQAEREAPQVLASLAEELLAAVSEDRLRVLLCDDVHYLDASSRAVLATLRPRSDLPLLEIWAGRFPLDLPGALPAVELWPLGDRHIRLMLARRAMLPNASWSDALVAELCERSGGLPRLIAAQLRSLERNRILEVVGGEWTWRRGDPASVLRNLRSGALASAAERDDLSRTALRVLATWHRPLSEPVLWRTIGVLRTQAQPIDIAGVMRELDAEGLVQAVADGWCVTHDAIADEVMQDETPESFHAIIRALLSAMTELQQLDAVAMDAFALLCGSRDHLSAALTVIGRASQLAVLRRQRLYGRRLANRIALSAGHPEWEDSLVHSVSVLRRLSPSALMRLGGAAAAMLLVLGWAGAMLQPRLVIESAPMGELHYATPSRPTEVVELVVQPRIGVYNGFGQRLAGFDGAIQARAIHGKLYGDTLRALEKGTAQFEQLTITNVPRAENGDWRSVAPLLEFNAGLLVRSVRIGVAGAWGAAPLRLLLARRMSVNGTLLDSAMTYDVPAGADSLQFDLTFEYSTPLATANYVVGAAGTWMPREQVIRLAGLPRPVREAWRSVRFSLPIPRGNGPHHVIIAAAPEESVQHLFSATNWRAGAPRWGDGNDLVDLPVSVLDSLRQTGRIAHDAYLLQEYKGPESDLIVGAGTLKRWRPSNQGARGAGVEGIVVRIR